MATQRPISTISYNTKEFLLEKLEELRAAHVIQYYLVIFHKGEEGDKDHFHVYVVPNRRLDKMDLSEHFREYQQGKEKPLGCMAWHDSKESDWILYAVHDAEYLRAKYDGDKCEKLPYEWTDIIAPDDVDVERVYQRAKAQNKHSAPGILKQLQGGSSPTQLVANGFSPMLINNIVKCMQLDTKAGMYRDLVDAQTEARMLRNALVSAGLEIGFNEDGELVLTPAALSGEDVSASLPEDIDGYFGE